MPDIAVRKWPESSLASEVKEFTDHDVRRRT